MFDTLQNIDAQLLLWINGFNSGYFNTVMWYVSDRFIWLFMYAAMLFVIVRNVGFNRKLIFVLLLFGVATGLSDYVCSSIIRPMVCRPRPSNIDSGISLLVHIVHGYRGGHYGFPSSHAANSFALATTVALYFRNRRLSRFLFAWAVLLCYSRLYLGVHYPGDILFGAFTGTVIAFAVYYAINYYTNLRTKSDFKQINIIIWVEIAVFCGILLIAL